MFYADEILLESFEALCKLLAMKTWVKMVAKISAHF